MAVPQAHSVNRDPGLTKQQSKQQAVLWLEPATHSVGVECVSVTGHISDKGECEAGARLNGQPGELGGQASMIGCKIDNLA